MKEHPIKSLIELRDARKRYQQPQHQVQHAQRCTQAFELPVEDVHQQSTDRMPEKFNLGQAVLRHA